MKRQRQSQSQLNRNANFNRNVNVNRNVNINRNVNRNVNVNQISAAPADAGAGQKRCCPRRWGSGRAALRPTGFGSAPASRPPFVRPANFQAVGSATGSRRCGAAGRGRIWWGGGWRTFVPLTALGVVALGGAYYYPDAYVSVARPYCEGMTPDGCRLNWQQIEFEGGGAASGNACSSARGPAPARRRARSRWSRRRR